MTKQLSPLEALKIIYDLEDLQGGRDNFWKAYRIIEKALKRLEELEKPAFILMKEPTQEEMNSFLERLNTPFAITIDYENEKKLKALEIIKEKQVEVGWLLFCFKENRAFKTYNSCQSKSYQLTKEEFDLLKEVLKWQKKEKNK